MIDEEKKAQIRAKYPTDELHILPSKRSNLEAVFLSPDRTEWKRFRKASKDGDRLSAYETLTKACVVLVEGQASLERQDAIVALDALFEKRPGLIEAWGSALAECAGLEEIEAKKL